MDTQSGELEMSAFIAEGRKILHSQPFSMMLGTELDDLEKGSAELSLNITNDLKQGYGYVHGGVISYMADNCLTFAAATLLGHCVTSEFKINYVNPAIGNKLIAKSTLFSSSLRQAVCGCRVYATRGNEELLVAVAQGTIVKIETDITAMNV